MTRDEFAAYLNDAADANKAPDALAKIRDGVTEMYASIDSLTEAKTANEATIAELRDVNMRMFLRQGSAGDDDDEDEEETLDEMDDRLRKQILGDEE